MQKQGNDLWKVLVIVIAFVGLGFVYKYTIAPKETATTMMAQDHTMMMGGSGVPFVTEIGADPARVPPPITRKESTTVKVALQAIAVNAELAPGVFYEYWTYNKQVPAPFIRVMEGDTVEVSVFHDPAGHSHAASAQLPLDLAVEGPFSIPTAYADEGHMHTEADAHAPTTASADPGHEKHSIDLHAVLGPGGGAKLTSVGHGETKSVTFTAMRPGIYVYHCASPHIPTHIANGMYGMILVEPKGGLPKVDHEYYVMQGELYTKGAFGEPGLQAFDKAKLDDERPSYVVFNGRVGSLMEGRALASKVGESVRIFFGVGTFLPSNFHVIGGILEKLYPEGDIVSPPHRNVQTTLVPAGGAIMTEFTTLVPGEFLLVDHALPRAIDKGAVGKLVVTGEDTQGIFK